MANYLIKSSLCLLVLLVFYHLFLEREKMHKFNRFYLLGSVLFSFCTPLFVIYVEATQVPVEVIQSIPLQDSFEIVESQPTIIFEEKFDYSLLLYGFYGLVTLFLLARFFKNIINIFLRIKHHTKIKINTATIVLLNDDVIPHTFWNYIFISKKEYENKNFNKELLTHELTHVAQYHTLDILCIELLKIVFWFNPLLYILKKLLQLNHEFLADEKVIKEHKNISNYQSLLLEKSLHATSYQLTSNLNYLVTKKRLTMMTKRTHKYSWLKQLAIVPLLVGLFFVFAERVEAQDKKQEKKEVVTIVEELPTNPNKKMEDSKIYKEYFYQKSSFQFKDANGKYISKKYDELNEEEKKRLAPPLPLEFPKKPITNELFQKLKNKENYAVWIDGKVVDNEKLNDYKHSDFSSHSVSFVYKNARSERFPQDYQANLQTHDYFKAQNKKRVEDFEKYKEENYSIIEVKEVIPNNIEKKKTSNEKAKKYIDSPIQNGSKQSVSKIGDIEDIRSKLKEINSSKIEYAKDTTKINSKKKEMPKSFLLRNNALSNFQFKTKDYIDDKKIAESKMTEDEKENFRYRNHIVNVSTLNSNSFKYEINGKITNVNEVYDYLLKNPDCLISTKKLSDNLVTLLFADKGNSTMTQGDLQNIYSEIFKLANSTSDIKNEILEEETKSSIKIILEKNGEEIKMECKKGCDWEKIEFKLSHNSPQIVNEKGLNKVNPRNADNNFYFVLLQDENVFDLKSTKNTKWKGLSGSSKEKMKLLINQRTIKSIIEKK